jgi:hypothetical protein
MVFIAVIVFALLGIIFILRRADLARAQSLVAGGTLTPGCVVFEGIILIAMATAVLVAWRLGAFAQ